MLGTRRTLPLTLPSPSSVSSLLLLGNPLSPSSGPGRASSQMARLCFIQPPLRPLATKPCGPCLQQAPSSSPGANPQPTSQRPLASARNQRRKSRRGDRSWGPVGTAFSFLAKQRTKSWSHPVSMASGHQGGGQNQGQGQDQGLRRLWSWKACVLRRPRGF